MISLEFFNNLNLENNIELKLTPENSLENEKLTANVIVNHLRREQYSYNLCLRQNWLSHFKIDRENRTLYFTNEDGKIVLTNENRDNYKAITVLLTQSRNSLQGRIRLNSAFIKENGISQDNREVNLDFDVDRNEVIILKLNCKG